VLVICTEGNTLLSAKTSVTDRKHFAWPNMSHNSGPKLSLLQGIHYQLPTFHILQLHTIYLHVLLFMICCERFQVLTVRKVAVVVFVGSDTVLWQISINVEQTDSIFVYPEY
jgi:hypothetical protein